MLVYAWIVLVISAIIILLLTINVFADFSSAKGMLSGIIPMALWIIGCLWYIFGFAILPYELVIGIALGSSLFYSMVLISTLKDGFNILLLPSSAALVFFILAAVL